MKPWDTSTLKVPVACQVPDIHDNEVSFHWPRSGSVLHPSKARLKNGDLQVLFSSSEEDFYSWYTLKYFPQLYSEVNQMGLPSVSGSLKKLGKALMCLSLE